MALIQGSGTTGIISKLQTRGRENRRTLLPTHSAFKEPSQMFTHISLVRMQSHEHTSRTALPPTWEQAYARLPRPHPCSAFSPFLSYFPLTHSEVLFFFFNKSQDWIPVSGSVLRENNLTIETIQLVLLSFKPPAVHLFCYSVPYILSLLLW